MNANDEIKSLKRAVNHLLAADLSRSQLIGDLMTARHRLEAAKVELASAERHMEWAVDNLLLPGESLDTVPFATPYPDA